MEQQTKQEPDTRQVVLPESLVRKVEAIKARRGGTIKDIIVRLGGPAIDEEYRDVLEEMQAELGEEGA